MARRGLWSDGSGRTAPVAPALPGHGPGRSRAAGCSSARLSRDWVSAGLANGFPEL